MKKVGNILWGIVLIAIGLVLSLNALEITNINIFFDGWWTLFIIVPCFIGLVQNSNKIPDLIGILVGVVLLLAARDIITFDIIIKMIFPIALVIIGLAIIFQDTIGGAVRKRVNKKVVELGKDGLEEYCATFGEQKVKVENDKFKGANLDAVFGGVDLDLTNAKINEEKAINASAIFGGVTIHVPNNVNVEMKGTSIFGGSSNKVNQKKDGAPTIYIKTFSLFGGVEVK